MREGSTLAKERGISISKLVIEILEKALAEAEEAERRQQ